MVQPGVTYVFTDGACSRNGKENAIGGMGVFFADQHRENRAIIPEAGVKVTNQTMELQAIVHALQAVLRMFANTRTTVVICSDSSYSIKCVTEWIEGWIKKGWVTATKEPVKNKEIIEKAWLLMQRCEKASITVEFRHVRAHGRPPANTKSQAHAMWYGNDRADAMARSAVDAQVRR